MVMFSFYSSLTLTLCPGELGLNDEEEGALIEIMSCAIKRAAGEDPPPGRGLFWFENIKLSQTI